jgi:PhzF family phenazine biosynthesis protein
MEISQFIVDAFTKDVFGGNPASVCSLASWPSDELLENIAKENNLSETAFIVGGNGHYDIRWFTPSVEVDLCGHATLASAFVVLTMLEPGSHRVVFSSKSGLLTVEREGTLLTLDFPARPGQIVPCPEIFHEALALTPRVVLLSRDYLVVVDTEEEVLQCNPKFTLLQDLPSFGIIISAPGKSCDFVSRVFFPTDAILEDPVTGSAHCTLIPYWSKRLGKTKLHAKQVSARSGELFCLDCGDRVKIAGHAALYGKGVIHVPG